MATFTVEFDTRSSVVVVVTAADLRELLEAIRAWSDSHTDARFGRPFVSIDRDRARGVVYQRQQRVLRFTISPPAHDAVFRPEVQQVGRRPRAGLRLVRAS